MNLTVRFGSPSAGWLACEIAASERTARFVVSYTPNDFLRELLAALCDASEREGSFIATFYEEPTIGSVGLTRIGKDIRVIVQRKSAVALLELSGSVSEVILPFWRALRRLQEDPSLKEWQLPFPEHEMGQLGEIAHGLKPRAV